MKGDFYLITEITIKEEGGRIVVTAVTEELLVTWGDLDFGIAALILKENNVRSDCSEEKLIRHGTVEENTKLPFILVVLQNPCKILWANGHI